MAIRRRFVALVACVLLTPVAGHTFPSGPPYPDLAGANGECISLVPVQLMSCATDQHVSRITGAADISMSIASMEGGSLPGHGYAYSAAWFFIPFDIETPVTSVSVRGVFHIEEAKLSVARAIGGLAPGPTGFMYAYAGVDGSCEEGCSNETFVTLLDAGNPGTLTDETVEVIATVTAHGGGVLEGGFLAQFELAALTDLGVGLRTGIGSFEASARAVLIETSLTTQPAT